MNKKDPIFGLRKINTTLWACYNKGGKIINTPTEQTAYSIFDINRAHTECSQLNDTLKHSIYEVAEKGIAMEMGTDKDIHSLTDAFLAIENNVIGAKTKNAIEEIKKEIKAASEKIIGQVEKSPVKKTQHKKVKSRRKKQN